MAKDKAKQVVQRIQDLQPRPNVDAVIDHFMQNAGGAAAFAKLLFDEFNAAQPGSMIRAKIVDVILRRMEKSEERNRVDDYGTLTEEDLAVMLAGREKAMLASLPDGEEDDPEVQPDPEPEATE